MFGALFQCFTTALRKTIDELYLNYQPMTGKEAMEILGINDLENRESRFQEMQERNRNESPYLLQIINNANEFLKNQRDNLQ
ncbi:hypothetical protein M153_320008027 [Pseudoloma neurophilia]|uniref:Uncharacterized protein n=1 Tax=Pseudoloma neurophilia TaxID=146866 RepID=A0A0R0M7N8_9MICR|nr:hypothetical protein M153_320008027 [Pseudoloma neurophilia]